VVIARAAFGVWGYTVLSKKKGNGDRLAQATSNKEQNGHVLAVFTVTSAFAFPLLPVNKPTRIGGDSTGCKLISIPRLNVSSRAVKFSWEKMTSSRQEKTGGTYEES